MNLVKRILEVPKHIKFIVIVPSYDESTIYQTELSTLFTSLWKVPYEDKKNKYQILNFFGNDLHPKEQIALPSKLMQQYPNDRFICTTTSPCIFLGLPVDTALFTTKRDENNKIILKELDIDLANVQPNLILTSDLFGLDSVRSIHNKGIEDLIIGTQQEVDERKRLGNRLKELYKNFDYNPIDYKP